ncbi:MAG: gliding motility-associated C-terminal domain-containing protein, partial [Bacteroidetes bacterium]|nr:gliding motility-associated C-terminal domain-containing protein [Bacteroidota bacterium]
VTDDTGAVASDIVVASLYYIDNIDAGNDTSICENSHALLGGDLNINGAGISYSWMPTTYLDNNTLPRPTSTPLLTTTYTLTATSATCPPFIDNVTVTIIPTPNINAGPDVTIQEGEVTTLNASGGFYYAWAPLPIEYQYTYNPDVEPVVTTTYYLYGTYLSNKCANYDSVIVTVIPNDEVVFYNTFTPNNDGNNDTWYIGNIYKYPNNKLEVYNRNGKIVFKANSYRNTWDGYAFGEALPEGTYFFVMDLGDGKGVKHGTVTIIK